jgi:hypothetical protein
MASVFMTANARLFVGVPSSEGVRKCSSGVRSCGFAASAVIVSTPAFASAWTSAGVWWADQCFASVKIDVVWALYAVFASTEGAGVWCPVVVAPGEGAVGVFPRADASVATVWGGVGVGPPANENVAW